MKNKRTSNKNQLVVLSSIGLVLVIFFGTSYVYKELTNKKFTDLSKKEAEVFQRPYSYVIGDEEAPVQLVEFIDPACGTCAKFHPYIKDIIKKYDGQVKWVVRYAPFHKNADEAVKMLEAAREQGYFLEALELMFATQQFWVDRHTVKPNILLLTLSRIKGLDMDKLKAYIKSSIANDIVKQELADAKQLNVTRTPGYIVNGIALRNFGLDNLKDLIETELNR